MPERGLGSLRKLVSKYSAADHGLCACEEPYQVRPATVLGLELMLQQPCVELDSVVSLLQHDRAAALCAVCMAGLDCEFDTCTMSDLAYCVACIDLRHLVSNLSTHMY